MRNIKGMFASRKMGGPVYFDSLIERDFIYLLEYEPHVIYFKEQPFKIQYQVNGRRRRYTPDFHFIYNGIDIVAECKPVNKMDEKENQQKFTAARTWCAEQPGHPIFKVITDSALRHGYFLANVRAMHNFSRYSISEADKEAVVKQIIYLGNSPTIGDVLQRISPQQPLKTMITIMNMGWHHNLVIPLNDAPITPITSIELPTNANVNEYSSSFATLLGTS